jgi:hypothetical protein
MPHYDNPFEPTRGKGAHKPFMCEKDILEGWCKYAHSVCICAYAVIEIPPCTSACRQYRRDRCQYRIAPLVNFVRG